MMNLIKYVVFLSILVSTNLSQAATFKIEPLSENAKNKMKAVEIYKLGCPVSLERLRVVKFGYYDFDGKQKNDGQIVVIDAAAERVLAIFKEIYNAQFPISKAHPIEYYKGNDEVSMKDNNSSSFSCRAITGGGLISIHSYGLAIDINPIQNPYLSFKGPSILFLPDVKESKPFINRTINRPGMLEDIKAIFEKNGFSVWGGGDWHDEEVIDWQHFQTPRPVAQLLAAMSVPDAFEFFELYTKAKDNTLFKPVKQPNDKIVTLYQKSPEHFMKVFKSHQNIFSLEADKVYNLLELS